MRKFEKISLKQFKNDFEKYGDIELLYKNLNIPKRHTKSSAGYDFSSAFDFTLNPGEVIKIPTGIKALMECTDVLMIVVRSSMGFKYNIRMCNQVGIIDADYYNNEENEGHMWLAFENEGDKPWIVKSGDHIAQGIFVKYLLTEDDETNEIRNGGLGSTDIKESEKDE